MQAWHGYHRFQIGLYSYELLVRDALALSVSKRTGFFDPRGFPNKYFGYFFYIAFLAANAFIWRPLNVATNLVQFGGSAKRSPLRHVWRSALSRVMELVHVLLAHFLRFAGDSDGNVLAARQTGPLGRKAAQCSATLPRRLDIRDTGVPAGICLQPAHGSGTTPRLSTALLAPKTLQRRQADYEKTYKQYEKQQQPRVRSVKYAIDVYPESRNITMRARAGDPKSICRSRSPKFISPLIPIM